MSIVRYIVNNLNIKTFIYTVRSNCNIEKVISKKQESFFKTLGINVAYNSKVFYAHVGKTLKIEKDMDSFMGKISSLDLVKEEENLIINILALAFSRDILVNASLSNILSFTPTKSYSGLFFHTGKGAGGDESMFFLDEYSKAYNKVLSTFSMKKTQINIYKVPPISQEDMFVLIASLLEGPVIRVQREPVNAKGKVHTSTIVFMPVLVTVPEDSEELVRYLMSPDMIEFDTFRSSGAGGQHVNKTESAVRAKHKILDIVCISRDGRSQISNKKTALDRMSAKIREDLQEAITGAIYRHFVSADRSMKAQTFNYKRDQITYHYFSFSTPISTYFDNPVNYFSKLWDKIILSCLALK